MCFTYEISVCLSLYGCAISYYLYFHNSMLFYSIGYFTLMEILQTAQYWVVADDINSPQCNYFWNKLLTTIGFVHICYQPYFINLLYEIKYGNSITIPYYTIVKRLCLVGGTMLLSRHFNRLAFDESYSNYLDTEWLNGDKLCTYKSQVHFAWSIPLADVSYYVPSINMHFFLFFIPLTVMYENKRWAYTSAIVFITGPVFASYMTSNLQEQASIWCLVSIIILTKTFVGHLLGHYDSKQRIE
jgi:hypothetical protein